METNEMTETEGLVDNDVLAGAGATPAAAGARPRLELREDAFDGWQGGVPNRMGNTAPRPNSGGDVGGETPMEQEMTEPKSSPDASSSSGRPPDQNGLSSTPPVSSSSSPSSSGCRGSAPSRVPASQQQYWESNYKEASIFLEEGLNNQKFTHHPRTCEDLPAYLMVHNSWFHLIDLAASLVLMALGFVEAPCKEPLCVPVQVHSSVELCVLVLVGVQVFLKTRSVGWGTFLKHKRTLIKCCTLCLMVVEAIVVTVRSNNHFRVSRALRPIFLMDNHYCGGVRRFIRQILQSLPPILDMLGLVFFVMLIYSVFGFYLFGAVDSNNFGSLHQSFISLFVLVTTANYPDVMMRSYDASRWACLFFISYLSINLYFLMNLMLAVVYDAFTRIEKEKFRRLFLHKRRAAEHAFRLLTTRERPEEVSFHHFEGLLRSYTGVTSTTEAYLVFKYLNTSCSGFLSLDEFYHVYDATLFKWKVARREADWFQECPEPGRKTMAAIKKVVTHRWFEYAVCVVVSVNGAILLVQTYWMDGPSSSAADSIYAPWVSYFFVALYTLEAVLKLFSLGVGRYFASYWNLFDFSVTALGILSLILQTLNIPLFYIVILRPLRLLTLFRMKKRFRDVFGTAVILGPRLLSAVIVLLLVYFFFGIIGMESFSSVDLINCCKNSSVEQYYNYVEDGSSANGFFYLNNFQSLAESMVTLFELTVVNNWYVIMEGYAIATEKDWSRIFFMSFYVFTMIVITIIVAFILEAFLFRIQYKRFLTKAEEMKKLSAEMTLTSEEILRIVQRTGTALEVPPESEFRFVGVRARTKEQLQLLMYTEEMENWIAEARQEEANSRARVQAAILRDQMRSAAEAVSARSAGRTVAAADCNSCRQVVEDDDDGEACTIHRTVLPDL